MKSSSSFSFSHSPDEDFQAFLAESGCCNPTAALERHNETLEHLSHLNRKSNRPKCSSPWQTPGARFLSGLVFIISVFIFVAALDYFMY